MYLKHTDKIKDEIAFLQSGLSQSSLIGLNLEKAVEKCLMIAQNLNNMWVIASIENKRRLQNVVFPEGIFYDKQKEEVRTEKMNSLFLSIPPLQRVIGENKKGNLLEDYLNAGKVPRTGFEPAHPFERCDLNTVRLPISPPGHPVSGLQI